MEVECQQKSRKHQKNVRILKYTREIKIGIITVFAILIVVSGVNFLKGRNFFGGDSVYFAFFPESAGLAPASDVLINGVSIGKVLKVDYQPNQVSLFRKVKVTFTVTNKDIQLPIGTIVKIAPKDLFSKALALVFPTQLSQGYYAKNSELKGEVTKDMMEQIQEYADPISKKIQKLMTNVDHVVESFADFWDTTTTSEIQSSLIEAKSAISRFNNLSFELEGLVKEERSQLHEIFSNVASITSNIEKSNKEIASIIGNSKKITDDLVTSDYKKVISEANKVISLLNKSLEDVEKGKGTLGKFLKDETFYNELLLSNKKVQSLLEDIQQQPERYIRVSVFGRKSKGLKLTKRQEEKLIKVLDTIQ